MLESMRDWHSDFVSLLPCVVNVDQHPRLASHTHHHTLPSRARRFLGINLFLVSFIISVFWFVEEEHASSPWLGCIFRLQAVFLDNLFDEVISIFEVLSATGFNLLPLIGIRRFTIFVQFCIRAFLF